MKIMYRTVVKYLLLLCIFCMLIYIYLLAARRIPLPLVVVRREYTLFNH